MQDLYLDFLHPTAPRVKPSMVVFVIGVLCALAAIWQFHHLSNAKTELQAQLGDTKSLLQRKLPQVITTVEDPQVKEEIARANTVLSALGLPWDAMFQELEAAGDKNVALLAIQPEAGARHIRLIGEARRFEDMLAYITRLEASRGFSNVLLTSHAMREDADQGIDFTLSTDWAEE